MGYKVKNAPKGAVVYVVKPKRVISLDKPTQAELKILHDLGNPYVEKV